MLTDALKKLGDDLDRVVLDDQYLIGAKVQKDEVVLGILPEPLQRLHQHIDKLLRESQEKAENHALDHKKGVCPFGSDACREFAEYAEKISRRISLFTQILQLEMEETYPNHNTLGIREGWQVVFSQRLEDGLNMLRALLLSE